MMSVYTRESIALHTTLIFNSDKVVKLFSFFLLRVSSFGNEEGIGTLVYWGGFNVLWGQLFEAWLALTIG